MENNITDSVIGIIKSQINSIEDVNDKIELITAYLNEIDEIHRNIVDYIDNQGYEWCPKCNKYSLKKDFKIKHKKEFVHGYLLNLDAGYGYTDELGDVEVINKEKYCPLCKKLISTQRDVIHIICSWYRDEPERKWYR